jgi:paraquat-inducible protein B
MSDNIDLSNLPEATAAPKKKRKISVVWIIPIVAALVAIGIAVQKIIMEGPTITIVFTKAEGIEAGKTFVKYKDVEIGHVTKVSLSKDFRKVTVTAKIDKSASGLLVEDAKFWIESPRATLSGVSGIGTLLSGNYIGLEPGKSTTVRKDFTGLENPPAVSLDEPGRIFLLQAPSIGSIGNGSPLYYRKLNVGKVIAYDLAETGKSVKIEVFVKSPYEKYVTDQTRFWQASGIDVSMGAEGLSVRTESVVSMLIGGIAFETPESSESPKPAADKAVFKLFNNRAEALANPETVVQRYVLFFHESLKGVSIGAPVTFMGLTVGEIAEVGLEFNAPDKIIRPRLEINIYPRRLLTHVKEGSGLKAAQAMAGTASSRQGFMQQMVGRGLRAQLRSGNLITGQRVIALDFFPDTPRVKIDWTKTPPEMPTIPSGLQDLEMKVNAIMAKLEKMPMDEIALNLKNILVRVDAFIKKVDTETMPQANKTIEELRKTLTSVNETMVGKDAPTQQQLREALQEITKAAQGVSGLTDYLERNPESLIRGKSQEKPK